MKNSNEDVVICFRFLSLDKLQAFTLEREIIGSTYTQDDQNNRYIGSVPLSRETLDDINDFFVRQRVALNECDIFVSAESGLPTNTIDIPVIANRMLKYIDCKLTFSFTVIEPVR